MYEQEAHKGSTLFFLSSEFKLDIKNFAFIIS